MTNLLTIIFSAIVLLSMGFAQDEESVTFTKLDSADWTLPENQDSLAPTVKITRKNTQSIFNITQEEGYSGNNGSPVGTLWAHSTTADANPEDYVNFVSMHGGGGGGGPQSLIDDTVSLYLTTDDLYYDVVIHSYTGGNNGGGFSWTRTPASQLDVKELSNPSIFSLYSAYPNPFNPITTLRYDLPVDNYVTLTIYDLNGRIVNQIVNTSQPAGHHSVIWNSTDSFGKPVSAGIYLYQIRTAGYVQTRKMVLLK